MAHGRLARGDVRHQGRRLLLRHASCVICSELETFTVWFEKFDAYLLNFYPEVQPEHGVRCNTAGVVRHDRYESRSSQWGGGRERRRVSRFFPSSDTRNDNRSLLVRSTKGVGPPVKSFESAYFALTGGSTNCNTAARTDCGIRSEPVHAFLDC